MASCPGWGRRSRWSAGVRSSPGCPRRWSAPGPVRRRRCCSPATPAWARPGCSPSCAGGPAQSGADRARRALRRPRRGRPALPAVRRGAAPARRPGRRGRRRSPRRCVTAPALDRLITRPGRPAAAPAADDDAARLQLFDAVAGALGDAAEIAPPLLLVIEDLHWADQSTRDLLAFLLARLRSERAAVVASYRADDLHRRHPLRPLLGELLRLPVVERLELSPFTPAELGDYLRTLSGGPVPDRLVRDVLARSEGNAYFAEELLAAGLAADPGAADRAGRRAAGPARAAAAGRAAGGPGRLGRRAAGQPLAAAGRDRDARGRAGGGAARGGHPPRAGRRRRVVRVPARAAAGGGLRRPAAGRAGPAARRPTRSCSPRGWRAARPSWPTTRWRATTCPGRCPPRCRRRPRRWTCTRRSRRCASWSGRCSCGPRCPTPSSGPAATWSRCSSPRRRPRPVPAS